MQMKEQTGSEKLGKVTLQRSKMDARGSRHTTFKKVVDGPNNAASTGVRGSAARAKVGITQTEPLTHVYIPSSSFPDSD